MSQSDTPPVPSPSLLHTLAEQTVAVALIGATIFFLGLSFRYGIDRGDDGRIEIRGIGHFILSVCAILSVRKHQTGRYVCGAKAHDDMQAVGLTYDDATLKRFQTTLPVLLNDTTFLNKALKTVFAL